MEQLYSVRHTISTAQRMIKCQVKRHVSNLIPVSHCPGKPAIPRSNTNHCQDKRQFQYLSINSDSMVQAYSMRHTQNTAQRITQCQVKLYEANSIISPCPGKTAIPRSILNNPQYNINSNCNKKTASIGNSSTRCAIRQVPDNVS